MNVAAATWQQRAGMGWTPAQIVEATGAHPGGPVAAELTSVSTDTRSIVPGALFVALRGPRHDGHDFAAEALQRGAGAVLVERVPPGVAAAAALIVPDTLRALGDLAAWTRRRHPVRVAAITGSNGKTTTKEMLASICEKAEWPFPRTRILKTAGTENNLIGVPLTLLRLTGEEAVAVLEMGMNAPGEIARLTQIAAPDVGLITNIGPAHLEGVGSIAGVAAAKGELFAGMSPRATIVVNTADPWVRRVAAEFSGRRVEIGPGGEIEALNVTDLGFDGAAFDLRLAGDTVPVRLRIPGAHMVHNALAAAGAAYALGLASEAIRAGLETATAPPMRMAVLGLANGVTVVNDAYNANPASMEAALRFVTGRGRPAVAVLGDMRELGAEAAAHHWQVGKVAAECGVRLLVAVGEHAKDIAQGARAGGMARADVHVCADPAAAAAEVIAAWRPGDTVLVKGSRGAADDPLVQRCGARMAEVVRLLEEAGGRP